MKLRIFCPKLLTLFILALCPFSVYADKEQVVIGALLPLTGDLGFVGEDIRRGMELALPETVGSSGKLKVIYMIVRDGKMVRFAP